MNSGDLSSLAVGVLVVLGICLIILAVQQHRREKRKRLLAKYGDLRIVEDIMSHKIWQGMTKEQLIDSWGSPVDTALKVFKTKTRETFKYNQTGRNRYNSRVMLEDDVVVGWQLGSQS